MPNAEMQQLQRKAAACQQMIDQCNDAITQLAHWVPEDFEFCFLVRSVKMFSLSIPPTESDFTLSFFISYRLRYQRQLEDTKALLQALQLKEAV